MINGALHLSFYQNGENAFHALLGSCPFDRAESLLCLDILLEKCDKGRLRESRHTEPSTPLCLACTRTGQYAAAAFRRLSEKLRFNIEKDKPDKAR